VTDGLECLAERLAGLRRVRADQHDGVAAHKEHLAFLVDRLSEIPMSAVHFLFSDNNIHIPHSAGFECDRKDRIGITYPRLHISSSASTRIVFILIVDDVYGLFDIAENKVAVGVVGLVGWGIPLGIISCDRPPHHHEARAKLRINGERDRTYV